MHAVCFNQTVRLRGDFLYVWLDDGYGSGRLPVGKRVDKDRRFVAVLQGIGQVEAANSKINNARLRGQTRDS